MQPRSGPGKECAESRMGVAGGAITWTRAAAGAEMMRNGTKIRVEVSGNVRDEAHRTVYRSVRSDIGRSMAENKVSCMRYGPDAIAICIHMWNHFAERESCCGWSFSTWSITRIVTPD